MWQRSCMDMKVLMALWKLDDLVCRGEFKGYFLKEVKIVIEFIL